MFTVVLTNEEYLALPEECRSYTDDGVPLAQLRGASGQLQWFAVDRDDDVEESDALDN